MWGRWVIWGWPRPSRSSGSPHRTLGGSPPPGSFSWCLVFHHLWHTRPIQCQSASNEWNSYLENTNHVEHTGLHTCVQQWAADHSSVHFFLVVFCFNNQWKYEPARQCAAVTRCLSDTTEAPQNTFVPETVKLAWNSGYLKIDNFPNTHKDSVHFSVTPVHWCNWKSKCHIIQIRY